jgi:hypothetical protein
MPTTEATTERSMSAEGNKAVVRRFVEEAFNRRNLACVLTLLAGKECAKLSASA